MSKSHLTLRKNDTKIHMIHVVERIKGTDGGPSHVQLLLFSMIYWGKNYNYIDKLKKYWFIFIHSCVIQARPCFTRSVWRIHSIHINMRIRISSENLIDFDPIICSSKHQLCFFLLVFNSNKYSKYVIFWWMYQLLIDYLQIWNFVWDFIWVTLPFQCASYWETNRFISFNSISSQIRSSNNHSCATL